jgi:acetylornithine/N-succinyldiaminopimelate aminotransferase
MSTPETIAVENAHMPPFFAKIPISIERGEGVWVWDEEGRRYLDLTAGWGVTSIGHAHPVIVRALAEQGARILQNPDSGLTYSPARARLLELLAGILPGGLTRVFFTNSGAEANDAAVKLARKATGRIEVIATERSFHGRTISMVSATGQARHRDKFRPQMPGYAFVPYGLAEAVEAELDDQTAAVIVEPVQGEGGVRVPPEGYLRELSRLCRANGSLLIVDEVQTGFGRTGPLFATAAVGAEPDLLTMAKGIAGGFPLGAFAMTEAVADRLEAGDHGGTYCGNPLACAVAEAVIRHLIDEGVPAHVEELGAVALGRMSPWAERFPGAVTGARGVGLLLLVEFVDEATAAAVAAECLRRGAFVRQTQGNGIRVFPALTITRAELDEGLTLLEESVAAVAGRG